MRRSSQKHYEHEELVSQRMLCLSVRILPSVRIATELDRFSSHPLPRCSLRGILTALNHASDF